MTDNLLFQTLCIARCRTNPLAPWISVRMNDHHYFDKPTRINRLWLDHPELRIRQPFGLFNYSKQAIRNESNRILHTYLNAHALHGFILRG